MYICKMFVRKKRSKSGSTSIQIIQKIDGGNKIIKTIGCSNDEGEIESIYHKAFRCFMFVQTTFRWSRNLKSIRKILIFNS